MREADGWQPKSAPTAIWQGKTSMLKMIRSPNRSCPGILIKKFVVRPHRHVLKFLDQEYCGFVSWLHREEFFNRRESDSVHIHGSLLSSLFAQGRQEDSEALQFLCGGRRWGLPPSRIHEIFAGVLKDCSESELVLCQKGVLGRRGSHHRDMDAKICTIL